MKDILMILSGIVGVILFMYIKNKVFTKAKESFIPKSSDISTETFDKTKAITGLVDIKDPVLWAKDIISIINLRKLIIYGVVAGLIFGYAYWKGRGKGMVLSNAKEWIMKLDSHYLHWDPNANEMHVQESANINAPDRINIINVKDIPNLYAKLKPYGFQFKPIITLGVGKGTTDISGEVGAGVSYFKWFRWRSDITITNKGFYPLGIHYKITENSGLGLSTGMGLKKGETSRTELKYIAEF